VIPLVAGLAARDAAGEEVQLKWPNDLVLGGRKVGGLLVEAEGTTVTIGLGLNLWWPDPIDGAGALLRADPGVEAPDWIAEHWADLLLERLSAGPRQWGRDEYSGVCTTLGKEITWHSDGTGTAVAISDDGGLVVTTPGGETVLRSGEVSEIRPAL